MVTSIDVTEALQLALQRADESRENAKFADAVMHYSRALDYISRIPIDSFDKLNDLRYPAILFRAQCFHGLRMFEQAIEDFSWVTEILSQEGLTRDEGHERAYAMATMNIGSCFLALSCLPEAQEKFEETEAILSEGALKGLQDLAPERASLAAYQAKCYRALRSIEAAESHYRKSVAILEKAVAEGWDDSSNNRATVYMNMGNFLHELGRNREALASYKDAVRAHELNGLEGLEQAARIMLNRAICLTSMRELVEAEKTFQDAHAFFWGENLGERGRLNFERIMLAMNRGICFFDLEKISEAESSYIEAIQLIDLEDKASHPELTESRALILTNLANCYLYREDFGQAAKLVEAAYETLSSPELRARVDLDPIRLKILVVGSQILDSWSDPGEWIRRASRESIRATMELAPEVASPWTEMRENFAQIHRNWLAWCLSCPRRHHMIPEVISAVQGREMVSSFTEQISALGDHDSSTPLQQYLALRREFRRVIAQMHRLTGMDLNTNPANGGRVAEFNGVPSESQSLLFHLSETCEKAREGLQKLKLKTAREQGLESLLADHKPLSTEQIKGFLRPSEIVLLAFQHEGKYFALLIFQDSEPELVPLPGFHLFKENQFSFGVGTRDGLRSLRSVVSPERSPHSAQTDAAVSHCAWDDAERFFCDNFWRLLEDKLIDGGDLIVVTSGEFHNIAFELAKPKKLRMLTRLPGISFLALTRGFYGRSHSNGAGVSRNTDASILIDQSAKDIPLATSEGQLAARLWQASGSVPDFPTSWPKSALGSRFLHVTGHGKLDLGLANSRHAVIVNEGASVGELELTQTIPPGEALINTCVAGQSFDNPLDGVPTGIVPALIRNGTHAVIASVFPLPDTWALLAGLILTDLRCTSDRGLPFLLELARSRLIDGGWRDRVSDAFSEALISTLSEPRYGPDKKPDGQLQQRASLFACIKSDLRFARTGDFTRSRQRLEDRFAEEADQNWWLDHNPELIDNLLAAPKNAQQTLESAIREAVQFAQENGTPRIPEVDTVRYGWTLFGDPNPAEGNIDERAQTAS